MPIEQLYVPPHSRLAVVRSFALLVCVSATATLVSATLISSSELQVCYRSSANGSNAVAEDLPCSKKFVVAIAVDGGQDATEQVVFWQTATEAGTGKQFTLKEPVRVTFRKSVPLIRYPLIYERNFNAKPRESTVYTTLLQGCHASAGDSEPTCGRAYRENGDRVPYSEGFCCSCSACELFGLCGNDDRGNTRCALLNTAAAAACLHFDDLWYSGYRIGAAETWYRITVTVQHGEGAAATTSELLLGPDRLAALDANFGVSARLVGDFAAFREPPNFEDNYLLVPSLPLSHSRVASGISQWMLVPRDRVSVDGRECNKVGVSYEGFTTQPSRCDAAVGSCLNNQPLDLALEDDARVAAGVAPRYFVQGRGDFGLHYGDDAADTSAAANTPGNSSRRLFEARTAAASPHLAYSVANVQASLLVLSFVADNMSYSINTAAGRILSVNSTDFEALSGEGRLTVVFVNVGELVADFIVSVVGCTHGTFDVQAKTTSVRPAHVASADFALRYSLVQGAVGASCNVTLQDATYAITDWRAHSFNVTAQVVDSGAQGGEPAGGGLGGPALPPQGSADGSGTGGCTDCPFYNPVCFLLRSCFWQVVVQIVVVVAVVAVIAFAIKHRRVVCCCLYETEDEKEERRANEAADRQARQFDRQMRHHHQQQQRMFAGARGGVDDEGYGMPPAPLPQPPTSPYQMRMIQPVRYPPHHYQDAYAMAAPYPTAHPHHDPRDGGTPLPPPRPPFGDAGSPYAAHLPPAAYDQPHWSSPPPPHPRGGY